MFTSTSKTLLRNVIRHTDTHNRIKEESEMWQTHKSQKHRISDQYEYKHDRDTGYQVGGVMSTMSKVPRAHMDRDTSPSATYWKRKLQEVEEKDPNRWGHAGYKELYPEQFVSDSSSSSSPHRRKKKKSKRWDHSGFKQLYPEKFVSDRSTSSSSERTRTPKSKRKKVLKHHKSKRKHKHRDSTGVKHGKKRKKHKSREKESKYVWVPKSSDEAHTEKT